MSLFSNIPLEPKDPIFISNDKFNNSKAEHKMNLTFGVLMEPGNEPNLYQFKCVSKAQDIISKENLDHEYPPLTGLPDYNMAIQNLFFDKDSRVVKESRIMTVQGITGGAALTIGADLLSKLATKSIYLSNKTWSCYQGLFQKLEIKYYPYYDEKTKAIDFENMSLFFSKLEKGSVVSFIINSHNPTGLDLNLEQWGIIGKLCATNKIFVFFDIPYAGYSTGSFQTDITPVRLFESFGVEMFIAYSTEKNFGLYTDNCGAFMAILNKPKAISALKSHLIVCCRTLNSFPSLYPARIIIKILNTPELKELWESELKSISDDLKNKRQLVLKEFEHLNIPINNYVNQQGLYLFLDINQKQVDYLGDKYNVFVVPGGRVSISCISSKNVKVFAEAVKDTINNKDLI